VSNAQRVAHGTASGDVSCDCVLCDRHATELRVVMYRVIVCCVTGMQGARPPPPPSLALPKSSAADTAQTTTAPAALPPMPPGMPMPPRPPPQMGMLVLCVRFLQKIESIVVKNKPSWYVVVK